MSITPCPLPSCCEYHMYYIYINYKTHIQCYNFVLNSHVNFRTIKEAYCQREPQN